MPIRCICKYCGKEFETYPAEIKKGGGKFCCSEHYHLWIKENKTRSGENSNLWKNAKVEVICKQCGTVKLVYKSQIKWRGSSFCSKACRAKWISEHKSGKNSWHWKDKIKCICKICGKEFEKHRSDISRGKGLYCSSKCYGESETKENNGNWNGGSSFAPYCFKFNAKRKKAVRDFFSNACICCGKSATENIINNKKPVELSVHHIDHNKDQGCNGVEFNLVPLCVGCHAKEQNNEQEYTDYINKALDSGFEWGIWSKERYTAEVMYN